MDTTTVSEVEQFSMVRHFGIRRIFLILLIISLSISALIAIFVFLFGTFGEIEFKLLLTTMTVGGYSLTGLCSSVLYDRKKYIPLAFSGIVISVLGFLITVGAIWEFFDFNDVWKSVIIFTILAFSMAHSSLLLLARSTKHAVNICLSATIIFIAIVALMLIYLVLNEFPYQTDELFYRLLGVCAILDVLGTIVTPILRRVSS